MKITFRGISYCFACSVNESKIVQDSANKVESLSQLVRSASPALALAALALGHSRKVFTSPKCVSEWREGPLQSSFASKAPTQCTQHSRNAF